MYILLTFRGSKESLVSQWVYNKHMLRWLGRRIWLWRDSKYAFYPPKHLISPYVLKVYAYLRRLGYAVTRNEAPSVDYLLPPPFDLTKRTPKPPLLMRLRSPFIFLYSKFLQVFTLNFNWWKPLRLSKWIHHNHGLFLPTFKPSGILTAIALFHQRGCIDIFDSFVLDTASLYTTHASHLIHLTKFSTTSSNRRHHSRKRCLPCLISR